MRWDDRLAALAADLQQQAEGLGFAERDLEVAEQARAEYAGVDLCGRLLGSLGRRLELSVTGVGRLEGVLSRVGDGWFLVVGAPGEWAVRLAAVGSVRGLAAGAVPAPARPVTARLGWGSALRGLQELAHGVVLHRLEGTTVRGSAARVGADFVEVVEESGTATVVPFTALAAAGPAS